MQINKLRTYVGFAVKSGNIIFGVDQIKDSKKNIKLILACNTLSDNTMSKLSSYSTQKHIELHIIEKPCTLSDIVGRENCKAVAIIDEFGSSKQEATITTRNIKQFKRVK